MSEPGPPEYASIYAHFRHHHGPKSSDAGLKVEFSPDKQAGIHFKVDCGEYRNSITDGIQDGMAARFPNFLKTGGIWITEITQHPIDSSSSAFYLAARSVIEQAYIISQVKYRPRLG
jgi:hypothetical protein